MQLMCEQSEHLKKYQILHKVKNLQEVQTGQGLPAGWAEEPQLRAWWPCLWVMTHHLKTGKRQIMRLASYQPLTTIFKKTQIILLITSNVSQGPDCLFTDMLVGGCHQAYKSGNGSALHHSSCLVRCPRGNVGQRPGSFKLDWRTVCEPQEGHELGDQTDTDHLVNRRMLVTGQQLPAHRTIGWKWVRAAVVADLERPV